MFYNSDFWYRSRFPGFLKNHNKHIKWLIWRGSGGAGYGSRKITNEISKRPFWGVSGGSLEVYRTKCHADCRGSLRVFGNPCCMKSIPNSTQIDFWWYSVHACCNSEFSPNRYPRKPGCPGYPRCPGSWISRISTDPFSGRACQIRWTVPHL